VESKNLEGKQGWAFVVRDVVKDNPETVKELSKSVLADLKAASPAVYEEVKNAVAAQPTATLSLKDPDTIREMLANRPGELLAELKKDPALLGNIPYPVLNDPRNREAVKTLVAAHPVLLNEIPAWQSDINVVAELIGKNATVFGHIDRPLRGSKLLILAALKAEQKRLGNFHWDWVPDEDYRTIVKLTWGGDPSAGTLLEALLDPSKYLENPQRRFVDAIPIEEISRTGLLRLSHQFKDSPEIFARLAEKIKNKPSRSIPILSDIDGLLLPLLTGKRAKEDPPAVPAPEVMKYITPNATGLTWEKIIKLAQETGSVSHIDIKKFSVYDIKENTLAMPSSIRKEMWLKLPDVVLADFLNGDLVPRNDGNFPRNEVPIYPELIREIGPRIEDLRKNGLITEEVSKKLLERK
jgi:hypothetical protein